MGILHFWDVVSKAGVERSLAQWAADHLKEHGRPLRIAIDEAHWRYKNVSDAKEADIQKSCPGSHPREKAILERIQPLRRLSIELLFVFDGENRPELKRGTKRYGQREGTTALLKCLLEHILVPWHQAPGEAEAECALLQQKGLVDAVWSEDSDSFMFGCTLLVRDLRNGKNQKLKEEAQVFDMRDIRQAGLFNHKRGLFNKKSITLFGILAGCDYAPTGLSGCGMRMAFELAQNGGLVEGFWRIETAADAARWRTRLEEAIDGITSSSNLNFNKERSNIRSFPNLGALKSCRKPVVSDAATLDSLPFLQGEWYGTHTTESLTTTIPWMQHRFFSRMTTIWWVEQFVPMTINQRFLKDDTEARNLVAKVIQKRRESPTSSVEIDPCQVFPGIETTVIVSEGSHLLNRRSELDRQRGGQPIKNAKFNILDAILSRGLSDTEFQCWRKEPRTPPPNKIHPLHPPSAAALQQMSLGSGLSLAASLFSGGVRGLQVPSIPSNVASEGGIARVPHEFLKHQQQMLDDIQSNKKRTPTKDIRTNKDQGNRKTPLSGDRRPGSANRSGDQPLGSTVRSTKFDTAVGETPTSPEELRRKRLAKHCTSRGGGEIAGDARPKHMSIILDQSWSLDDEDHRTPETGGERSKKRKSEEPFAEQTRHKAPGAWGRQMLLEMELDSSQDCVRNVPVKAKGNERSNTAAKDIQQGAAKSPAGGGGKGTADKPFEIA